MEMPATHSRTSPPAVAGDRVLIRDAEWLVRRVELIPPREYGLVCTGVSELVRDQEAVFLNSLDQVEVLDPVHTRLCTAK